MGSEECSEMLSELMSNSSLDPESQDSSRSAHPRFRQYKSKKEGMSDQQERRQRALQMQKKARDQLLQRARKFVEQDEDEQEMMDTSTAKDGHRHNRLAGGRRPPLYKDELMQSEWLLEVPSDLDINYMLVLVPEGKRNLLVARRGTTTLYSRQGYQVSRFESELPGGSHSSPVHSTVMDCIVSNLTKTIYVLDLMMWAGKDFYGCSTELRQFMRDSKLQEHPELLQPSKSKLDFKFKALQHYDCDNNTLTSLFERKEDFFEDKLDGLLFYHKDTHYEPGVTPLVTWLKVFMVPEMLNVPVSEFLLSEQKPIGYSNMADFIAESQKRAEEAKRSRGLKKSAENKKSQDMLIEENNNNNYLDKEVPEMQQSEEGAEVVTME